MLEPQKKLLELGGEKSTELFLSPRRPALPTLLGAQGCSHSFVGLNFIWGWGGNKMDENKNVKVGDIVAVRVRIGAILEKKEGFFLLVNPLENPYAELRVSLEHLIEILKVEEK